MCTKNLNIFFFLVGDKVYFWKGFHWPLSPFKKKKSQRLFLFNIFAILVQAISFWLIGCLKFPPRKWSLTAFPIILVIAIIFPSYCFLFYDCRYLLWTPPWLPPGMYTHRALLISCVRFKILCGCDLLLQASIYFLLHTISNSIESMGYLKLGISTPIQYIMKISLGSIHHISSSPATGHLP